MSIPYIYKITNTINGKIYIGQTNDFYRRRKEHRSLLRTNKHVNRHLQFAWNYYGENSFSFEILEECPIDRLNERESYWISTLKSRNQDYGYNILSDETFTPNRNLKRNNNFKRIICLNNMIIYETVIDAINSDLKASYGGIYQSVKNHTTSGQLNGIPCVWMEYDTFKKSSIKEVQDIFNAVIYKIEHRNDNVSKKVVLLNTKEVFDSIIQAGLRYGVDNSTIAKCCKGKQYFAGIKDGVRLVWATEDVFKTMSDKDIKNKINEVNSRKQKTTGKKVVCIELNEVFESIMEASRILKERGFVHVSPSSLADNLKDRCDHGGYDSNGTPLHWKYL